MRHPLAGMSPHIGVSQVPLALPVGLHIHLSFFYNILSELSINEVNLKVLKHSDILYNSRKKSP
jgi:hypothetical protein